MLDIVTKRFTRFALVIATVAAVGTSSPTFASSFKQAWKEASSQRTPSNSIVGAWEGTWQSKAHGVSGPLKCVISDLGNGRYQAAFNAQFHWFHFNYVAELAGEKVAGALKLTGQADLGWMGGVYHYVGTASPARYSSVYKSDKEDGVLDLKRPGNG